MIDIKSMNEQHKQCNKITNTLFLVGKIKKLNIKMAKKNWPDTGIYIYYLHQLKSGFKRKINRNKYQSKLQTSIGIA